MNRTNDIEPVDFKKVLGNDLTQKLLRDSRNKIQSTADLGELSDALIYATDKKKPFFKRLKRTFTPQKKLGRTIFDIADLALIFLPGATPVKIINKIRGKMMDKPKLKSKSIWCAIIIFVTALLENVLGIDFGASPEMVDAVYKIIYFGASALGIVGLRDAVGKMINKQDEVEQEIKSQKKIE